MKTQSYLFIAILLLPIHFASATIVNVEGGALNAIGQDRFFNTPAIDNGTGLTFNVVGVTVTDPIIGLQTFDFDFTITPVSGVTDVSQGPNFAGNSANSTFSDRFSDGDQIALTVSNITNPNIQFDGIAGLGLNFAGSDAIGFTADIGGTPTTFVIGGPFDPRFGAAPGGGTTPAAILIDPNSTITFLAGTDANGLSGTLRGVNLQFSVIPEPASISAIMALITLPLLSRRRRVLS